MSHIIMIDGMSCQHCVRAVTGALGAIDGLDVQNVEIGKAVVASRSGSIDGALVREAVAEEGFTVVDIMSDAPAG